MTLTKWIPIAGIVAALAVVAMLLAMFGPGVDGWQRATRHTGRLAFHLFLVVLTGPAVLRAWTANHDRSWFLAFAGAHLVHLAALGVYLHVSGIVREPVDLAVGGLAYAALGALAVAYLVPRLRRFAAGRFRIACLAYIWLSFMLPYAMKVSAPEHRAIGVYALSMGALAVLARFGGRVQRRPA